MKFSYKYIIYKVYSWSINKKGDTPIANTVITLGIVHFFQLLTLILFIDRIIVPINGIFDINKMVVGVGLLLYFVLLYFVLYNKQRWNSYLEELNHETDRERKRGNRLVLLFLIGSILLFFIALPVLFTIGRK